MTISVDDVLTEAALDEYLGGQLTATVNLMPAGWTDAEPARQWALDRVLQSLKRRTPPILEGDIADVTELRDAVIFGAASRLYDIALTSAGESEVMFHKWREYDRKFNAELSSMVITGPASERIVSRSPSIMRR